MKYAILTSANSLVLPWYLNALKKTGVEIELLLVDGYIPDEDSAIDKDRLGDFAGKFMKNIWDLSLINIPTFFTLNHNSLESVELLQKYKIDFLINGGTPRILKSPLLDKIKGVINSHPGILPRYRGCSCVEWSIYNDDLVGATAHIMGVEIDKGPILFSKVMQVELGESYESIRSRMILHQAEVLCNGIKSLQDKKGDITAFNVLEGGNYYSPIGSAEMEEVKKKLAHAAYSSL